jgi:sugar lactone lactonase YvrE
MRIIPLDIKGLDPENTSLLEGPRWDAETQRLLCVDILERKVYYINPFADTPEVVDVIDTGVMVGFAVLDNQGGVVAGLPDGLYDFKFGQDDSRLIVGTPNHSVKNRSNDGSVGPGGRIVYGTMAIQPNENGEPAGSLYVVENGLPRAVDLRGPSGHHPKVHISNGLAWTQEGDRVRYSQTFEHRVIELDDDGHGNLTNPRTLVTIPRTEGNPDGIAGLEDNSFVAAMWGGAQLIRFSPNGDVLEKIVVNALQPSSIAVTEKGVAFVTTARVGMSPEQLEQYPNSGKIIMIEGMAAPGVPALRADRRFLERYRT